jgi:hypothetical protein
MKIRTEMKRRISGGERLYYVTSPLLSSKIEIWRKRGSA